MNILEQVLSHETVVPMEKLTDITVEEATGSLSIDLTGNTWGDHMFVVIRYMPAEGCESVSTFVRFNNNEYAANHSDIPTSSSGTTQSRNVLQIFYNMPFQILLFTGTGPDKPIGGFAHYSAGMVQITSSTNPNQITSLQVGTATGMHMAAGSTLEIWGIL